MSDTPETDKFIRTQLASVGMSAVRLAAKLTLKCEELERQRDSLAPSAWTLDWNDWIENPYPDTMRVVLATDGESMYVATYTQDDGWQDAYSGEPMDYFITYWCEIPELPQV